MLKITESANVAHYVGCDWVENSAVDFAAVFFRSTTNSRILNTNTKRKERSKKGDKRTQKQRLQIHV